MGFSLTAFGGSGFFLDLRIELYEMGSLLVTTSMLTFEVTLFSERSSTGSLLSSSVSHSEFDSLSDVSLPFSSRISLDMTFSFLISWKFFFCPTPRSGYSSSRNFIPLSLALTSVLGVEDFLTWSNILLDINLNLLV